VRHVSVQQVSAFLDGALAGVSRELVLRHIGTCAHCRERHARWKARDEALRAALAWAPAERTLEEWSARVEMTLTAERRGLPAPEFTPSLHPVIAPVVEPAAERVRELLERARGTGPEPPARAGREETRDTGPPAPVASESRQAAPGATGAGADEAPQHDDDAHATPPADDVPAPPATDATDATPPREPAANEAAPDARPPHEEGMVEVMAHEDAPPTGAATAAGHDEHDAEAEAEHDGTEAADPPAADPTTGAARETEEHAPPIADEQPVRPASPRGTDASPTRRVREPAPASERKPTPGTPPRRAPAAPRRPLAARAAATARRTPPLPVPRPVAMPAAVEGDVGATRAGAASRPPSVERAPVAPTATGPAIVIEPAWQPARVRRRLWSTRGATVVGGTLLAVLLATPFLPDVIRIPLPERWPPRLPRIEFVRRGGAPVDPAAERRGGEFGLASRTAVEPVTVREPAADAGKPAEGGRATATPPAPPASVAGREPESRSASATAASSNPDGRQAEGPGTRVEPVRRDGPAEPEPAFVPDHPATVIPVRVRTTVQSAPEPVRRPAPVASEPESDETWPLLCGEVLQADGTPVEGARVQLVAPALAVRTDRRGRFCIACPAGTRAFRIEVAGRPVATRTVELSGTTFETRVTLPATP